MPSGDNATPTTQPSFKAVRRVAFDIATRWGNDAGAPTSAAAPR